MKVGHEMTREQIHIGDMSRETAIDILKLMLEAMETYDGISPTPERINAIKMSIETLEQEPKTYMLDKIMAEIKQEYNKYRNMSEKWSERACGIGTTLEIINKYKAESENKR